MILNEARRRGVVLYQEPEADEADAAPVRHEPKHVALHTYLLNHSVLETATDFRALRVPTLPAEFRGTERDIGADLTEDMTEGFKTAVIKLFSQDLQDRIPLFRKKATPGSTAVFSLLFPYKQARLAVGAARA